MLGFLENVNVVERKLKNKLRWFEKRRLWKETTCFGIIGTHHGVGTTQISINLSYYLSEVYGGRVAVIELNESNDFELLEKSMKEECLTVGKDDHFQVGRITFYKHLSPDRVPEISLKNFDYCVLDIGIADGSRMSEFLRCRHKIVVCSLTEWRRHKLEEFLEKVSNIVGFSEWNYISNLCTNSYNNFEIIGGVSIKSIAFMEHPFWLGKELIKTYRSII